MDDENVIGFMAEYRNKMKVAENRIADLERQTQQIQELVISVHDLASSVKQMVEEQKEHGERLQSLEDAPREMWKTTTHTILTTLVGVAAGALAVGLVQMIAKYI